MNVLKIETLSFFVINFIFSVGFWPSANSLEKGWCVLRLDTYANSERTLMAAVEKSTIIKGFHILKGEYGTKTACVILPNGDKGTLGS